VNAFKVVTRECPGELARLFIRELAQLI
jgi:hypothetical protein